ncbi:PPA1309 family protein [Aquipuribacter sp. MA13-6]|uniref:PPA1309 family protein n=1 Tax=unclassified Aquipuribacter TaxID=2635084 RepID=UPI003EE83090
MSTDTALQRAVREVEEHVASYGWDSPVRLFALVRTAEALQREPDLLDRLPAEDAEAAAADPDHLLLVEQDELDELAATPDGSPDGPAGRSDAPGSGGEHGDADALERMLARLAWPDEVQGVALTVERLVVPPEVEAQAPPEPAEAVRWLAEHPRRRDVRIAAAVLRDGGRACVLRTRGTQEDPEETVVSGPDLVPGLTRALAATLED